MDGTERIIIIFSIIYYQKEYKYCIILCDNIVFKIGYNE
jgi:hypothetical protein